MSGIYLILKVKRSDQDQVDSLVKNEDCADKLSSIISKGGVAEFLFCELKNEELGIESELLNKGIPYDKKWE
jgi:hypothetical protein